MRHFVVLGVAMALSVSSADGQSGSNASPADVARDFFSAERDGRWLDAARLLDLKSFEPQRAQSVANARHAHDGQPFHLRVDQMLRHDPSMPRAVAEYEVKKAEEAFRDFNPLAYEYADVPTADSLAALPIDVAGARWLEAKDPRWRMKSQPRSVSAECAQLSDSVLKKTKVLDGVAAASMFAPPPLEVVAVAPAGPKDEGADSLSYVLFRERYENRSHLLPYPSRAGPEIQTSPRVLTLIRTPAGWRVYPALDFGFVNGFASVSFDCAVDSVKAPERKK